MARKLPYVRGSKTSKAAAVSQLPVKAAVDEARVAAYIYGCGLTGSTDDEIEVSLGMIHQTASARRNGLARKNLVVNSGRTRPTRTGCHATVWISTSVAEAAKAAAIAKAAAAAPPPVAPPVVSGCPHGETQRMKCVLCRTRR